VIRTPGIDGQVLPARHAACILVERVEKPTDNRPARLLCYRAADDSAEAISPALGPGAFPYTLHAPGPAATSTKSPVPC
jgi:hypothetical protein